MFNPSVFSVILYGFQTWTEKIIKIKKLYYIEKYCKDYTGNNKDSIVK